MWQSQAWKILFHPKAFPLNSPALSLSAKITRRLIGSPQQEALGDTKLKWHSAIQEKFEKESVE